MAKKNWCKHDYYKGCCDACKIETLLTRISELEGDNKEKMDIIAKGFNEAAEQLLEPLKEKLATAQGEVERLRGVLTRLAEQTKGDSE